MASLKARWPVTRPHWRLEPLSVPYYAPLLAEQVGSVSPQTQPRPVRNVRPHSYLLCSMSRRARKVPQARPKMLSKAGSLGQRGINLIERIVIHMGSRWTPSGANEAGIDGYIELFEPDSQRATSLHLAVQSKAVTRFEGDDKTVKFSFKRDDIAYWLDASLPVVVVVSCPDTEEAYWVSVPRYFGAPENAGTTVAHIDRRTQRFTARSYDELLDAARPPNRAIARSPAPAAEVLYSNLLPLRSYPNTVYIAPATCKGYRDVYSTLRTATVYAPHCWLLHEGNYLGFADPADEPLCRFVDAGAIEAHESANWAESSDPNQRRLFSWLLNGALQDDLASQGIRFFKDDGIYAFKGSLDRVPRTFKFRNLHRDSEITVVTRYQSTSKKDGTVYQFLRHHAFGGRFRHIGGTWHLEITPTYRFTDDGKTKYRFHAQQLAGIKRYDGNRALLSQLIMWSHVLAPSTLTLFDKQRLLGFGPIQEYRINGSIPDEAWAARDAAVENEDDASLPLFGAIPERW
jgi:hypothetical protein